MNYNTDGFNDRMIYIYNSNDKNNAKVGNFDSSFAEMRVNENKPDIQTANSDKTFIKEEAKGDKENFVLRNFNINHANAKVNKNNPVSNAMMKNMFRK